MSTSPDWPECEPVTDPITGTTIYVTPELAERAVRVHGFIRQPQDDKSEAESASDATEV